MEAVRVALISLLRDRATFSHKLVKTIVREKVPIATSFGLFLLHLFLGVGPLLLILFPSSFISSPPWDEAPPGVVLQASSFNG